MKVGSKYVAVLLVIAFTLNSYANSVIAVNFKSISKNEVPTILDELNACAQKCDPHNPECPIQCLKNTAAKDENAFVQFLNENQVAARGAFCIFGCAAAESCEQIRAGGKGMLCSHYYALG